MKRLNSLFLKKYSPYILTATGFLVWITFFDRSNLINMFTIYQECKELRLEKEKFDRELEKIKTESTSVFSSQESKETFAREKYMMKKEGETIFVLVDEDDKPILETDKL